MRAIRRPNAPGVHVFVDGGLSLNGYFTSSLAAAIDRPIKLAASPEMTAISLLALCDRSWNNARSWHDGSSHPSHDGWWHGSSAKRLWRTSCIPALLSLPVARGWAAGS